MKRDTLGEVTVPVDAMYGAQTQRARENFRISGVRFPRVFIRALGLIKGAAAQVNFEIGLLDANMAHAIGQAADESAHGLTRSNNASFVLNSVAHVCSDWRWEVQRWEPV